MYISNRKYVYTEKLMAIEISTYRLSTSIKKSLFKQGGGNRSEGIRFGCALVAKMGLKNAKDYLDGKIIYVKQPKTEKGR